MTAAETFFHELASSLPGGKKSAMFGAPCIKAGNGKAACMYWAKGDAMVFRLEGEDQRQALALDGAQIFDPMGNRPMGGWVQLPAIHLDRWRSLAELSLRVAENVKK